MRHKMSALWISVYYKATAVLSKALRLQVVSGQRKSGMNGFDNIAVVVPTYNERENIVLLAEAVLARLGAASRVLVVDDGSPDGTADLVRAAKAGFPGLDVLERPCREGLGPAYMAGFRRVLERSPAAVVQMDADFSHRPEDLPGLLAGVLREGADLAVGSRYVRGGRTEDWGPVRRLTSRFGSTYARWILGVPVRDITGGFRCWRPSLLAAILEPELRLRQFGFQIEMLYRAHRHGALICEVPIVFPDRIRGHSKMRFRIAWEALIGIWRLRLAGKKMR
jgi:dolichol-phosphate mannosyltransferase